MGLLYEPEIRVSQRIRPEPGVVFVGLLDTTAIPIPGVMPNALLIKSVFISVFTGNTNLAQGRPNLPKSYRQVLLTASWLATILTMDVTRHFTGMVHDKRLQM